MRSVSDQMSSKVTAQRQGLGKGKRKYEGRLNGKPLLMLLLSTADAADYTDDSYEDIPTSTGQVSV